MSKYIIRTDFEKQRLLKTVELETKQLKSTSKRWILKQLNIAKSTYYDWLKTGGITKDKTPNTIWNKTSKIQENLIINLRDDYEAYRSQRSPAGIACRLEEQNIYKSIGCIWNVLCRNGKNRELISKRQTYIIYPRSDQFLEVVCIDDIQLTNKYPRDLAIFNAIDEYSQSSLAISFLNHKLNHFDVIDLLNKIKTEYGKYPKIVRLDNAKAHISKLVEKFCKENNIKLQFIDKGIPQQNWPVESFNKVIKGDLLKTSKWDWSNLLNKQVLLEEYIKYYNTQKQLISDPLKRTPNEISTGITSENTQVRLKFKLIRKHYGQVKAFKEMIKSTSITKVISPKCA